MDYIDKSYDDPYSNIAYDEALLNHLENQEGETEEILRFWESPSYFVVLGYSNKREREVHVKNCKKDQIPIIRRISGGGTVLQGPGCLNYALILSLEKRPELKSIKQSNQSIIGKIKTTLNPIIQDLQEQGQTDLCIGEKKISGNAQRRGKKYLLFHGTFLYQLPLQKIEEYLKYPSQTPDYRKKRKHNHFLTHVKVTPEQIKTQLKAGWEAQEKYKKEDQIEVIELVGERYIKESWNNKF